MNRERKEQLRKAYEPPTPLHKKEFLQKFQEQYQKQYYKQCQNQISKPGISTVSFLWQQAGYIRKSVWVFSILFFMGAVLLAGMASKESVWVVAAMIPFLAVFTVCESMRSVTCHMEELEMAARYPMKYVVMGKIVILGVGNLVLLFGMAVIFAWEQTKGLVCTGTYFFVPYLLTGVLAMHVLRRMHNREAVYFCMGIAVLVSGLQLLGRTELSFLYTAEYQYLWLVAALMLAAGLIRECICTIRQTEEYVWN